MLLSHEKMKKKWPFHSHSMGTTRDHYAKWNKTETETILWWIIYRQYVLEKLSRWHFIHYIAINIASLKHAAQRTIYSLSHAKKLGLILRIPRVLVLFVLNLGVGFECDFQGLKLIHCHTYVHFLVCIVQWNALTKKIRKGHSWEKRGQQKWGNCFGHTGFKLVGHQSFPHIFPVASFSCACWKEYLSLATCNPWWWRVTIISWIGLRRRSLLKLAEYFLALCRYTGALY